MNNFSNRSVFGRRTNAGLVRRASLWKQPVRSKQLVANCWKYLSKMSWSLSVVSNSVEKRGKNLIQICIRHYANFASLIRASGASRAFCVSMLHFSLICTLVYRGGDRKRTDRNLRNIVQKCTKKLPHVQYRKRVTGIWTELKLNCPNLGILQSCVVYS